MKAIYDALEIKRSELNLTEEALCEGICSVRTYRRYIYEETDMPFSLLEKFSEKLNQSIYDLLYFVEHRIKLAHMDEVLLLDTLIQDDYEKASKLYETFKKNQHTIVVHPFLLPLMLEKLKCIETNQPLDRIHKKMIQALHLDVLARRPFLTVEHIKLIEHVLPFMNVDEKALLTILFKRIINGEMDLIRASKYTKVKCYQLYFQLILDSDDQNLKVQTFLSLIKKVYEIGGELAIDEIFLQAKMHDLHLDDRLSDLFKAFHLPASFMYHQQNPLEDYDDVIYLQSIGLERLFELVSLKEVIYDALS
jgi:hypothetical protein